MNRSRNRLLLLVSVLLVVSAGLFAVGSGIEHGQTNENQPEATVHHSESSSETSQESSHGTEAPTHVHRSSEKIAGIDPESWPVVALATAASLLLGGAVYRRRSTRWLLAAAVFGLLFAAGDVRELVHQLDESRTALAVIAGVLIALHVLVAAVAAAGLSRPGAAASSR